MVGVNEGLITTVEAPFGGVKESGPRPRRRASGHRGLSRHQICLHRRARRLISCRPGNRPCFRHAEEADGDGEVFGTTPEGEAVQRFTISGGGLTANIMSWGAALQDLRLAGHDAPLVLGFDRFDDYPAHSPYFGAIAGRYANRIRDGRFTIDGKRYQADTNFLGKHTLHGGAQGFRQAGLGRGAARRRFRHAGAARSRRRRWAFPARSTSPAPTG